jgi:hypothetical protein
MTALAHVKGWGKNVVQVGSVVWGLIGVFLGIAGIANLFQTHHPVWAVALIGTEATLIIGSVCYAIEYAEMKRRARLRHY